MLWSPWKLEGAVLDEGTAGRAARRRPGAAATRHRHRQRRRADPPALRHDVHRAPRRRRLREARDGPDPRPLRRQRADRRRRRDPRAARLRERCRLPPSADRSADQVGAARPDDHDRHALRRALRQPREAGLGVRDHPQPGGEGAGGCRRRHHPVRRARVQRLLRRGERLGRRGAWSARSRACAPRPRCTSATATASRRTPTGRRHSARSGGSTRRRSRTLQASTIDIVSLECHHSHVPMELIELIRGKKVMVGAIDVASDDVETPEEVARHAAARPGVRGCRQAHPELELRHGAAAARRGARQAERAVGRRRTPARRARRRSRRTPARVGLTAR